MITKFKIFEDFSNLPDLKILYNEFNQLYFNNSLPDIPIVWKRLKNVGGRALCTYQQNHKLPSYFSNKYTILSIDGIEISNYRNQTSENIKSLLMHEMIHIYLYTKNIVETDNSYSTYKKGHGKEFIQKLEEIQSKIDFKIPLTEDNIEVSDKIKTKSFDCITISDNQYKSICIFIDGFFDKTVIENGVQTNIEKIKNKLQNSFKFWKIKKPETEVKFFKSNDRFLLNFKVKRTISELHFYELPIEDYNRIINNTEIITELS